ncbi:MAG TPA: hypothetical protein PK951_01125 [Chitinophagaceae bacterium]|nr:hypothetical protein [Chitinophagaceae bacterium]
MANNFDIFKKEFLEANTWEQRKDGVPLYLLDRLTKEELKSAEAELIKAASHLDEWPIVGLGHIKSKHAVPTLLKLLSRSKGAMKVIIAHSIFQISQDEKMKEIVLETVPQITGEHELIDVLFYLPLFKDNRITDLLSSYTNHPKYLVAYNATRYLGLPTDEVVAKFRNNDNPKSFWDKLIGK